MLLFFHLQHIHCTSFLYVTYEKCRTSKKLPFSFLQVMKIKLFYNHLHVNVDLSKLQFKSALGPNRSKTFPM